MYLQFIQPAPSSILSAANVTVKCTNAADSNNAGHICFNVTAWTNKIQIMSLLQNGHGDFKVRFD